MTGPHSHTWAMTGSHPHTWTMTVTHAAIRLGMGDSGDCQRDTGDDAGDETVSLFMMSLQVAVAKLFEGPPALPLNNPSQRL